MNVVGSPQQEVFFFFLIKSFFVSSKQAEVSFLVVTSIL